MTVLNNSVEGDYAKTPGAPPWECHFKGFTFVKYEMIMKIQFRYVNVTFLWGIWCKLHTVSVQIRRWLYPYDDMQVHIQFFEFLTKFKSLNVLKTWRVRCDKIILVGEEEPMWKAV